MKDYSKEWAWITVFRDTVRQRRAQSDLNLARLTPDGLHIIQKALVFWDQFVFGDYEKYTHDMTARQIKGCRLAATGVLCDRPITSYYDLTRAELFAFLDCAVDDEAQSGWRAEFAEALRIISTDVTFLFNYMISKPVEPLEYMEWDSTMVPPEIGGYEHYAPASWEE